MDISYHHLANIALHYKATHLKYQELLEALKSQSNGLDALFLNWNQDGTFTFLGTRLASKFAYDPAKRLGEVSFIDVSSQLPISTVFIDDVGNVFADQHHRASCTFGDDADLKKIAALLLGPFVAPAFEVTHR